MKRWLFREKEKNKNIYKNSTIRKILSSRKLPSKVLLTISAGAHG